MAITLEKLRTRKEQRRNALQLELNRIVEHLKKMGALRIVLFGSMAKGIVRSWSDIDILAVMPSTRTSREWMQKISEEIERYLACDILAYTREDLECTLPHSRFLRHVAQTGKILYESKP